MSISLCRSRDFLTCSKVSYNLKWVNRNTVLCDIHLTTENLTFMVSTSPKHIITIGPNTNYVTKLPSRPFHDSTHRDLLNLCQFTLTKTKKKQFLLVFCLDSENNRWILVGHRYQSFHAVALLLIVTICSTRLQPHMELYNIAKRIISLVDLTDLSSLSFRPSNSENLYSIFDCYRDIDHS